MERNVERKTLSFSKGMTNVPSDLLSDDTELAESNGFIYRDGEMKPVQEAFSIGVLNDNSKIVYVHKRADYKNIITWKDGFLYWYINNDNEIVTPGSKDGDNELMDISGEELYDVKSVGNTLIATTSDGIYYFLYKAGNYITLGNNLPKPTFVPYMNEVPSSYQQEVISAKLGEIIEKKTVTGYISKETGDFLGYYDSMLFYPPDDAQEYVSKTGYMPKSREKITDYLNAVQGAVSKSINYAKSKNCFCFPFFIRFALKLYDGSYARISNPIICYPTISRNLEMACSVNSTEFIAKVNYAKLEYTASIPNIEYWKDIVKELVVFASKEVIPYKDLSSTDYMDWQLSPSLGDTYTYPKALDIGCNFIGGYRYINGDHVKAKYKTEKEIIDELITKSQFYQLSVLATSDSSNFPSRKSELPIKGNVVSTLETQTQLNVDDYYGWTTKVVKRMYEYNSRINIFDYERRPFKGFSIFSPVYVDTEMVIDTTIGEYVRYYVHIVSEKMDTWVASDKRTCNAYDELYKQEIIRINRLFVDWFYYPDPNATEVLIEYKNSESNNIGYVHFKLSAHPMLNGAYSFLKMPGVGNLFDDYSHPDMGNIVPVYGGYEVFDSEILTSVVNNPFVFEASGDNTVGTGKIIGIAANTEAVSQGQHGYAPLIVFTTEGMYALKTNSEGLFVGVDPLPREVCNNVDSITPIDNYVIFTADKGLMAATGGCAVCLSEQMRGRTPRNFATMGGGSFLDFLKECLISYDYRDSLLRIFKKSNGYTKDGEVVEDEKFYYIYDLANKTFSMGKLNLPIKSVVNDYPDNLIQDISGCVYSLTGKPDINDDETKYSGGFTTRPLKLGGSMTLKSLRAIKHLYDTDEGKVKLEVYGSNDCKNWVKLESMGGKPWKYFTFKYTLTDFKACDSFAGTIVEVQSRREDKMR